jgi:hypothetical protein
MAKVSDLTDGQLRAAARRMAPMDSEPRTPQWYEEVRAALREAVRDGYSISSFTRRPRDRKVKKNPLKLGKFIKASAVRFRRVGKRLVVDIKRSVKR